MVIYNLNLELIENDNNTKKFNINTFFNSKSNKDKNDDDNK